MSYAVLQFRCVSPGSFSTQLHKELVLTGVVTVVEKDPGNAFIVKSLHSASIQTKLVVYSVENLLLIKT